MKNWYRGRRPQLSLLVPFRPDPAAPERVRAWEWLARYWSYEMPDAEIVMGRYRGKVFSKTAAVNDAAGRARGRLFVILDADAYIHGSVLAACATAIEEAARKDRRLWVVPYRHLYRLTSDATDLVLDSDPRNPWRFHNPPGAGDVERILGSSYGHRFGAMCQIMPREAFFAVGGMDPRFAGWGGEDVAFVRAVDTMWAEHHASQNEMYHLWHPNMGDAYTTRVWANQTGPQVNNRLATRYGAATGDRVKMGRLVGEHRPAKRR